MHYILADSGGASGTRDVRTHFAAEPVLHLVWYTCVFHPSRRRDKQERGNRGCGIWHVTLRESLRIRDPLTESDYKTL